MSIHKDIQNIFKPLIQWAIWHITPYIYTFTMSIIVVGVMISKGCVGDS
ncbi:uncharacterized protein METZ01_LOCUS173862 [marine metagenome]|uniref:Uncharacterized protein n=1 Tax=marine metagenome TaxID=408172 RepID=A0A382C4J9_9ZZZZ